MSVTTAVNREIEEALRLHRQGRLDEAAEIYRRMIREDHKNIDALNLLGIVVRQQGDLRQSRDLFSYAIRISPGLPDLHRNLGETCTALGETAEAINCFRRVLELEPADARCWYQLGNLLAGEKEYGQAIAAYLHALELEPRQLAVLNNLGMAYVSLERPDEAESIFARMVELDVDNADGYNNLGVVWQMKGDLPRACELFRQALACNPRYAEAWYNLGFALEEQQQWEEAITCNRRAIAARPDYAEARFNLALLLLLTGSFAEGWREYEWRWVTKGFSTPRRNFAQPLWAGGDFAGKTLLIHIEQGFGDIIQFIRYAPLVAARGGRVIVVSPPELKSLVATVQGVSEVLVDGDRWPEFQLQVPLLTLPRLLGTELSSIPGDVPYLRPDPANVERWRERLAGDTRFRVGLVWSGRMNTEKNRRRACPLENHAPLARISGISWYSLQVGEGAADAAAAPDGLNLVDLTAQIATFDDTAALIANLDLVIAIDTSVCHLAGALGKEVWTLLCASADWRWLLEREDSPWYPTMRLFRQEKAGDWEGVMRRVAAALEERLLLQRRPEESGGGDALLEKIFGLCESGRFVEADEQCLLALQAMPDNPVLLELQGLIARERGHGEQSREIFSRAVRLYPGRPSLRMHLGSALQQQGSPELAAVEFAEAVTLEPDNVSAINNLGVALEAQGHYAEAADRYRQALALAPEYVDSRHNLAHVLAASGDDEGAVAAYGQLLHLAPDHAAGWFNLGNALRRLNRLDAAEDAYAQAVRCAPSYREALSNRGLTLQALGKLDESASCFRELLETDPDDAQTHMHLAMNLLLRGDHAAGWEMYEWRLRLADAGRDDLHQPPWQGEDLAGRTILAYGEQGGGDTIQFARYLPLLASRGATVLLECQSPPLCSLMETVPGVSRVVCRGEELPSHDLQVPLMSLPRLFDTTTETIPADVPYVHPPEELVAHWRDRLGSSPGVRVGLVWAGNPGYRTDALRSIKLSLFAPLAKLKGICFFSLQVGEAAAAVPPPGLEIVDLSGHLGSFLDTAAALCALDLVITVDTAVAHLAGALGKQVWTLLPYAPDWRWLLHRDDTPWYPTMRLFRQESPGDWAGVLKRVADALDERLSPRLKLYFYRPGVDYLLPPRLQAMKIPLLYDEPAEESAGGAPRYDVLSIWQEDENGRPVPSCRECYETVTSPEEADFIVFPQRIDELLENFGGEGAARFIRQLPLFADHEEKHVFLTVHDNSEPLGISSVLFRASASVLGADPFTYVFPYRTEDFARLIHFDLPRIDYHTSFVGFTGSCEVRAPLVESIIQEPRLVSYIDVAERFYGHQDAAELPRRREKFLEYLSRSLTVLCPRGTGENSFRFFEAMSMGRIPVLVSDTCMLPFEDEIDYTSFLLRIPEKEVGRAGQILYEWISRQSEEELLCRCRRARQVWERYFRYSGISRMLLRMLRMHRDTVANDER